MNNALENDRIGARLTAALFRCADELTTDNLCILLAKAYHLLDEQEAQQ